MNNYIFSFAHIDKEKYIELKNSFLENPLSENYNIVFLTKKNFDLFFNNKFRGIKSLFFGNNLLFSPIRDKKVNIKDPLSFIKNNLSSINEFLVKFEFQFKLFLIISNNSYYFPGFLLESEKFNNKSIYNLIIYNKRNIDISILDITNKSYISLLGRINNLKKIYKKTSFISYMY